MNRAKNKKNTRNRKETNFKKEQAEDSNKTR